MFRIGDVVRFRSADAGYAKYHLCVSNEGHFIYLNSPRAKSFLGDFEIGASEITGVPPTPSGKSIISCTKVLWFSANDLRDMRAAQVGRVTRSVLKRLLFFVEDLATLPPETRDPILDGLGDEVG